MMIISTHVDLPPVLLFLSNLYVHYTSALSFIKCISNVYILLLSTIASHVGAGKPSTEAGSLETVKLQRIEKQTYNS